ncbi:MAG TPA: chemotaxis protein CheX [Longimicrobiales bacterium]|nr:chemotaxis protein CheX [Longimicrobiales bacterium]
MNTRSALLQAASSTLECLGFLFPDEELSETQAAADRLEGACRVRFRGPMSGALEMEVFGNVLGELAANMMGRDGPPEPAVCREALGEVANVVCGNVLPAVAGTHAVFDLSAPETGVDPVLRRPFASDTVAVAILGLGEGRVEIALRRYA